MTTPIERQLEASVDAMRHDARARAWKRMSAAVLHRSKLMTNQAPFAAIRRANDRVHRAIRIYAALDNPPTDTNQEQ